MTTVKGKNTFSNDKVFPVGTDVLLARPTGKGKVWQVIDRMHEQPTQVSSVIENVTTDREPQVLPTIVSFVIGSNSGETPFEETLSWEISDPYNLRTSIVLDYGDSGETIYYDIEAEIPTSSDGITYTLVHIPSSTPTVYVDAVEQSILVDFTWSAGSNDIVFVEGHEPGGGTVTVDYSYLDEYSIGSEVIAELISSKSHIWQIFGVFIATLTVNYIDTYGLEKSISASIEITVDVVWVHDGVYTYGDRTYNLITEPGYDSGVITEATEISNIVMPTVTTLSPYQGDSYKQRAGSYQGMTLEFDVSGTVKDNLWWAFVLEGSKRHDNDGNTVNKIIKQQMCIGIAQNQDMRDKGYDGAYLYFRDRHYISTLSFYTYQNAIASYLSALDASRSGGVTTINPTHVKIEYIPKMRINTLVYPKRLEFFKPSGFNVWINGVYVEGVYSTYSQRFPKYELGTSLYMSDGNYNNIPREELRKYNEYFTEISKDVDTSITVSNLQFRLLQQSYPDLNFAPYHT